MSAFDTFLDRNRTFANSSARTERTAMPANRVFVVTCIDPRVEPAAFLGLGLGDAVVLRNPGGRMTDSTIADIALISFMGEALGAEGAPMEVAVIHHTQCGMGFLADDNFRQSFASKTGVDEQELAGRAITDPVVTVRADTERLLASPLASPRILVSGHVLDLETGLVSTVVAATAPHCVRESAA